MGIKAVIICEYEYMKRIVLYHRGVYRQRENELESITAITGISQHEYLLGVEFDVQITEKGKIVCHHDQICGEVEACDFYKVITEIENTTEESRIINIELKVYSNHTREQITKLVTNVYHLIQCLNTVNKYIISSYDMYAINYLVYLNTCYTNHIDTGIIIDEKCGLPLAKLQLTDYLVINKRLLPFIDMSLYNYKAVLVYTVGDNTDDDTYVIDEFYKNNCGIIVDNYTNNENKGVIAALKL